MNNLCNFYSFKNCFSMKKQKLHSQKFQKKYFFFQKSFFDFLYWRSFKHMNSPSFIQNQSKFAMEFSSPFEQEKMSFYEYWKSPEQKKIENTFKSSTDFIYGSKNSLQVFKKKEKKRKFFSKKGQNFSFLTSQKFHSLFLKKRKEKENSSYHLKGKKTFVFLQKKQRNQKRDRNFKSEGFLPQNSSFELFRNIHFLKSQKKGEFFPTKKNFRQYWIFPFLGVFFFFSQNTSSSFLQKEKYRNFFSFESFQSLLFLPNDKKSFFSSKKNIPHIFSTENSSKKNEKKHMKTFEYSFSDRSLNEKKIFQNFEKLEYEEFLKFSHKIFLKSLLPEIETKTGNQKNDFQLFLLNEKNFQKKLETKRNSFCWKWYSLYSDVFHLQRNVPTSSFQIPQKAEFFMAFNGDHFFPSASMQSLGPFFFDEVKKKSRTIKTDSSSFLKNIENGKKRQAIEKNSAPLFDFSKNLFFLDELMRELSFQTSPKFFLVEKYEKDSFSNFKETVSSFKTSEIQKFLKNEFSQDTKDTLSEKNVFFLEKWSKTQKFSLVSFPEKKEKTFFKFQMIQNSENNRSQKFGNLDILYSKKIFQKFISQNGDKKCLVRFEKKKNRFSIQPVSEKKLKKFKKYTFDFYHLRHFSQIFQKLNHSSSKRKVEKGKTLSFGTSLNSNPFLKKNEKGLFSLEKMVFSKNFKDYNFVENSNFEMKKHFQLNRPLLFQFLKTEKIIEKLYPKTCIQFFEKPSFFTLTPSTIHTKMEFQKNRHFFPQNRDTHNFEFSFFSENQKKENFFFSFSKYNFFEKLKNNFFKKYFEIVFFNICNFESFQKNFLFETNEFQKAFLFSTDFGHETKTKHTFSENSFFRDPKSSFFHFFVLKPFYTSVQKTQKKGPLLFSKGQNGQNHFRAHFIGFSKKHRKFEKTFIAFFSPLNGEKYNFAKNMEQKENVFLKQPAFFCNTKKTQTKTKKDVLFLQSLSRLLKKNHQTPFSFFIQSSQKKFPEGYTEIAKTKKYGSALFYNENKRLFLNNNTKMVSQFFQKNSTFFSVEKSPSFFLKSEKKGNKKVQRNRLSPQFILKRDGFLFLSSLSSESKEKKNINFQRLEKEKTFQKKRRLQKEKLETRRRKKRKRFFPRPVWLRFNLYKKFLKTRHSKKVLSVSSSQNKKKKMSSFFFGETISGYTPAFFDKTNNRKKEKKSSLHFFAMQKKYRKTEQKNSFLKKSSNFQLYDISSLFLKKQNFTFQSKTYQKNFQKEKSLFLQNKKNSSSFPFFSPQHEFEKKQTEKVSENIEYYKMSNEIYREFLRLSWKSSWFLNNFKPYTRTIQKNFQKIQSVESVKNFPNFFDLFEMKNVLFFFHDCPFSLQSQNDFLIRKSVFQKFSWYSNVQNSFSTRNGENSFFSREQFPSAFDVEKKRKISEYNRILSKRISELLIGNAAKFKFSENMTNDSFFENLKVNRRKNENIFSGSQGGVKNSFFTKTALFFEKFQIPSEPVIPAFSVFSSLFQDFSIKPTGDMPTLRAMWAFQKTNFSHFRERNLIQNVWAFQKKQNASNSFKGTKKIKNFLRKKNFFEKFKTPQEWKSNWSFVNSNFQKEKTFFYKKKNPSQKNDFLHSLNVMTYKKFLNVEKKSSLFGIQSLKQNSKISYRYFLFHLSPSLNQKKLSFVFQEGTEKKNTIHSFSPFEEKESIFFFSKNKKRDLHFFAMQKKHGNKNSQNSAKSSFHFWWAQKPFQYFDFHGTSQFQMFSDFYKKNSFSFQNSNFSLFENEKSHFSLKREFFFSNISFVLFGAFFFHFALFYTLFKIPEIRSVFKLTFFLFSKFWTHFFFFFFSIYNLFIQYTKNGLNFLKSSSSFSEKKKKKETLSQKEKFVSFFNEQEEKNGRRYVFLNSFSQTKTIQFSNFVFEFFPRFSSFSNSSFGNISLFLNKNREKEKVHSLFSKRVHFFFSTFFSFEQKVEKMRRNQKFDSLSLFKLSENTFLKKGDEFSFFSMNQTNKTLLFEKMKKQKEKSLAFSKTDKNLSHFALSVLLFGKHILYVPYHFYKLSTSISTKIFEIFEGLFYAFYKFLEKPAEFMIEFIAFVFLIEWSSDILGFFPESIESSIWKSSQKLLRPVRTGTFFSLFGYFFFGFSVQNLSQNSFSSFQSPQNLLFFSRNVDPFQFFLYTGFFQFSNLTAYVVQKRLLSFFENAPSLLYQPDIDILVRQRKGILFWDIWAEILLKAAEKYNVNLPSFVTLKEEQELFIEKLVKDSAFFESLQLSKNGRARGPNFLLQNHPSSFFDFSLLSRGENSLFSFLQKSTKKRKFKLFSLNPSSFEKDKIQMFQNTIESSFFTNTLKNQKMSPFLRKKSKSFFPLFENSHFLEVFQQTSEQSFLDFFSGIGNLKNLDRWEYNQYATFQSIETDFFLDIYPPKSLKHVHFLKYYEPAHATLGSFICEIYAGIFPKQVSKNILVVGESGPSKTFFLRAFAGETEMKIITENASRYAVVQRGVAVGMKYLRDVFDAIALQTPCFFVMEDLHIIGSKRPFLISENENVQKNESSFGFEQQEVHETNQLIYQSSRHSISDFRRPYKGDFSMGIPTNSFLQTFYSPFFSNQKSFFSSLDASFYPIRKGHVFQNSQFFGGNWNSSIWDFRSSPLPLDSLQNVLENVGKTEGERRSFSNQKNSFKRRSVLQISKEQIFAPPATSPFTVLLMKEQKKLKPKKIVKETSWGGLSADQILLSQKESASIRAKIAVLAEKTMNLSRGKFDMITDLLVIIDSVRSNRGFVVFGTTHKPSSLDPALRRPGRFDETLSLSRTPNFRNRFEILKMNFENSISTFDFFDASLWTENFSEMDLFDIVSQTKLSFLHNYKFAFQKSFSIQNKEFFSKNSEKSFQNDQEKTFFKTQLYSQRSPAKAFHALLKSPVFEDFYTQKQFSNFSSKSNILFKNSHFSLRDLTFFLKKKYAIRPKGPSHMVSFAYSKLGSFIAEANILHDPTSFIGFHLDTGKNSESAFGSAQKPQIQSNSMNFYGNIFFDSFNSTKYSNSGKYHSFGGPKNRQLLVFLSGKVTEFMICSKYPSEKQEQKNTVSECISNSFSGSSLQKGFLFENPFSFFTEKFGFVEFPRGPLGLSPGGKKERNSMPEQKRLQNFYLTKIKTKRNKNFCSLDPSGTPLVGPGGKTDFSWTVYGNEENWRSATPFLSSLIQKRFLFTKNLLLSKMLFFENMDQRRKPPSPPGSSIFMPAKKYENFKRTEADFFQKAHFSIHEKIQMHQKQRFLKQLYNIPVQKYFRSELRTNQKTTFSSSFQEFAYFDSVVQKSSSSHFYYRKYIQVRHRFSNINQWWNGMFPEHTRETTYLSDVDWRTMFLSSETSSLNKKGENIKKQEKNKLENSKKFSDETVEFLMDFPDAEQYYNPRNRRWFFKSNSSFQSVENSSQNLTFWKIFEKDLQYEIFSHFLMESFYQSFSYFEKKRELLDFFAFQLLHKGFLKEFDFLTTFSRF